MYTDVQIDGKLMICKQINHKVSCRLICNKQVEYEIFYFRNSFGSQFEIPKDHASTTVAFRLYGNVSNRWLDVLIVLYVVDK